MKSQTLIRLAFFLLLALLLFGAFFWIRHEGWLVTDTATVEKAISAHNIPVLIDRLNNSHSWKTRARAAEGLGEVLWANTHLFNDEVLLSLTKALSDKNQQVREKAASALKMIGIPEAIQAVKDFEEGNHPPKQ